ncbi:MAG: hypothetical protein LQ351_007449 [Letrouitia transgressa]|nr:MAG: hypothetical protein LQ351_007449 [Letrouitia transgressa]
MPQWGRSSGAPRQKWRKHTERRFEEVDSDEGGGQGVNLDDSFTSDILHFTGTDLAPATQSIYQTNQDFSHEGSQDEEDFLEDPSGRALQYTLRDKEDLLVRKALERIRRAQMLGRTNVELTQREYDALERKRKQDRGNQKGKTSLRRNDRPGVGGNTTRDAGDPLQDTSISQRRNATPLGPLVPRLDGPSRVPFKSRVGPQPALGGFSPSGHRSTNTSNLQRASLLPSSQYRPPQPRHSSGSDYPSPPETRSPSWSRRLPDDPSWMPRPRSVSSSQSHQRDPYNYQVLSAPLPQATSRNNPGRRIVSDPARVPYPSLRMPVSSLDPDVTSSDPNLSYRAHFDDTLREESASNEDTGDDGDGYDPDMQAHTIPQGHDHDIYARADWSGNRQRRGQR